MSEASRGSGRKRSEGTSSVLVVLLLAVSVLGVARLQPRLARRVHEVKERADVFLLPPPAELRVATLGYVAAATDLLWAKLLVENGMHWAEHRPFPDLNRYVDGILALEPDYEPLYKYLDTMLVYRPVQGTEEDARAARAYYERGLVVRPWDPGMWLHYGQFIAFLAPSFLTSQDEKERWRHDGAEAIVRAVELGADADRTLAASAMMKRWGERDAAIRNLRRAYALTEDEATREQISLTLQALQSSVERDESEREIRIVESRWRRECPFLTRGQFLLIAPTPPRDRCVGMDSFDKPECAADWDKALAQP